MSLALPMVGAMTSWQITVDCADPSRLCSFWAEALDYEVKEPPLGFETWNDWYLSVGVPEDELDLSTDGADRIRDPSGAGPDFWFQVVPEKKQGKNRLHLDLSVSGGREAPMEERRERIDARSTELEGRGAQIVECRLLVDEDHYSVTMRDPEGNEFCVV